MHTYFKEAHQIAARSNCAKRKLGAVVVKGGRIVGYGWNSCVCGGCARNAEISLERCARLKLDTGEGYALSRALHAEVAAMLHVRSGRSIDEYDRCIATVMPTPELIVALFTDAERQILVDAELYLSGHVAICECCRKWMELLGIKQVSIQEVYPVGSKVTFEL